MSACYCWVQTAFEPGPEFRSCLAVLVSVIGIGIGNSIGIGIGIAFVIELFTFVAGLLPLIYDCC